MMKEKLISRLNAAAGVLLLIKRKREEISKKQDEIKKQKDILEQAKRSTVSSECAWYPRLNVLLTISIIGAFVSGEILAFGDNKTTPLILLLLFLLAAVIIILAKIPLRKKTEKKYQRILLIVRKFTQKNLKNWIKK